MSRLPFITLFSIVILALTSFAHWKVNQVNDSINQQQQSNDEADFFMINAVITQFNAQGGIDHSLKTDEIKHFPLGDITNTKNPYISLSQADGTIWNVSAKQGRMTDKNNIITLWNKVELDRNTPPNKLNIKTSKLTLIVSKNLAHTDQSVVIINNSTHINATGMEAYLEENRTKFLSNVRVTHDQVKIN